MPAQVTTRAQVNGYRLLVRRMEHALIRADSRMIHDPMRGQMRALLVGMVIALLVSGAAGVLAFFRPTPNFGDSTIMASASSGALFVRLGDRLHPVLNLASARLIVGKADTAKQVDDKFLNTVALGPAVGVVGAPSRINSADDMTVSSWTVCDTTQFPPVAEQPGASTVETTVLANEPVLDEDIRASSPEQVFLAKAQGITYLVYGGVRAQINPGDLILHNALRLGDSEIREVSPGLLNSFPLVDPIAPIVIDGVAEPTSYLPETYRVGEIVRTVDSHGDQLYVLLREGLQPISSVTADIIRYSNPGSPTQSQPIDISPALVTGVPVVHNLRVDHYPAASPRFVRTDPERVVCMSWQRGNSAAEPTTRLLVGRRLPLPNDAQPLRLATADGAGPGLDTVYLKPGTGEYVQGSGDGADGGTFGPLFYVNELGVRYHIADEQAATALGVTGIKRSGSATAVPQAAPWVVLALLPPGPELSQQAALIAHDSMAADVNGRKITPPKP